MGWSIRASNLNQGRFFFCLEPALPTRWNKKFSPCRSRSHESKRSNFFVIPKTKWNCRTKIGQMIEVWPSKDIIFPYVILRIVLLCVHLGWVFLSSSKQNEIVEQIIEAWPSKDIVFPYVILRTFLLCVHPKCKPRHFQTWGAPLFY